MTSEEAKKIIETLLFVSEGPLSPERIKEILENFQIDKIKTFIEELKSEYSQTNRTFTVEEVGGGYRLATDPFYGPWIKKLYKDARTTRLTIPALETLSIVAYKQPITKSEIEIIRGVNVDGVINTLLERGLIKISGRKEVPGRPFLYRTTQEFLVHFGLNSLEDLPKLKEFAEEDIELGRKQLVEKERGNEPRPLYEKAGEKEERGEAEELTQKD